jgi:hypothetical protein
VLTTSHLVKTDVDSCLKSLSFVSAFFNGAILIDITPISGGLIIVLIGIDHIGISIALLIGAVLNSIQVQDKLV